MRSGTFVNFIAISLVPEKHLLLGNQFMGIFNNLIYLTINITHFPK